jgi:hypothetical protein
VWAAFIFLAPSFYLDYCVPYTYLFHFCKNTKRMKKFFFLLAFASLFAFAANAQSKSHCSGKKGAAEKVSCTAASAEAAEKAASADASIVKLVSTEGEVSYTREESDADGKVNHIPIEYCTKEGKFVNVSPSGEKACCAGKDKGTKSCHEGEKKASSDEKSQ